MMNWRNMSAVTSNGAMKRLSRTDGVIGSSKTGRLLWVSAVITICFITSVGIAQPQWITVREQDGITVKRLERANNPLPAFMATGVVPGDLYDVLAVLDDVPRRTLWVAACAASVELQKTSDANRVLYHRTAAPWPIADRDAVVQINVTLDKIKKKATIRFKPSQTVQHTVSDKYVRMRIEGYYDLKQVDESKTRVKYYVDADPGGWLPDWLIRLASEKSPLKTLQGLRRRVKASKAANQYADFLNRYRQPSTPKEETKAPEAPTQQTVSPE